MVKDRHKNRDDKSSRSHRNPNLLSHYHECASRVLSNVDRASEYLHNQFLKAAKNGEIERIRNFLKRSSRNNNVNVDYKDKNTGNTAIFLAVLGNHLEVVKLLLNYGADITLHNKQGQSVIELAPESIRHVLLASVERQGVSHRHLLQAAWQGNVGVLRRLLSSQAGLDVNCKNADGMTPLLLVTRDIDLFEKIESDVTERGYHPLDVLRELLLRKANISVVSGDGRSALHYVSSSKGKTAEQMAKIIIDEQDYSMELPDEFSCFPIHIASKEDNYPVLIALINGGADVNVKGYNGQTPLHMSAVHGHERISSALIDSGADITLVDDNGYSPVDVTTSKRLHRVLREAWAQQTKDSPRKKRCLSAPSQHSENTAVEETQESHITSPKEKTFSPRKPSSKDLNSTNVNSNVSQCSKSQNKKPLSRSKSLTAKPSPIRTRNDIYRPQIKQISSRSQETAIFTQERIELPKLSVKNIELNNPSSLQREFPSLANIQRMRLLTPGHSRSLPVTPCSFGGYQCGSGRKNLELSMQTTRRNKIPARIAPLPGYGSVTPDLAVYPNSMQSGSSLGTNLVDLDLLQNDSSYLTALAKLAISSDALTSPPQPPTTPSDENKIDEKYVNGHEIQATDSCNGKNELQLVSFEEADTVSDDDIKSENKNMNEIEIQEMETSLNYQTQTFSTNISTFWIPNTSDNKNAHNPEINSQLRGKNSKGNKNENENQEKAEGRERTSSMSSLSFYVNLNDVTKDCVSCNKQLDLTVTESQMCTTCELKEKTNSQQTTFWISMDGETSDGESLIPNDAFKVRYLNSRSKCTYTRKTKSLPSTCQPSMPYHIQKQPANDTTICLNKDDLKLISDRTFIKESNTKGEDNEHVELTEKDIGNDNETFLSKSSSQNQHGLTIKTKEGCDITNVHLNPLAEKQNENILDDRCQSEGTFDIEYNEETVNKEQMCLQNIHGSNDNNVSCMDDQMSDNHINGTSNEQKPCKTDCCNGMLNCTGTSTTEPDHRLSFDNNMVKEVKPMVNKEGTNADTFVLVKDKVSNENTTENFTQENLSKDHLCQTMCADDKMPANETDCTNRALNDSTDVDAIEEAKMPRLCNDGVQISNAFPSPVPPSCPKPVVQPAIGDNKTAKRKTSAKKGKKGSTTETKKCTKNRAKSGKEQVKKGKKKLKKKDEEFKEISVNQSNADATHMQEPASEPCDVEVPSPDVDNVPTLSLDARTFTSKVLMRMFPVLSPIPESLYSNTSTPRSIEISTAKSASCNECTKTALNINKDSDTTSYLETQDTDPHVEDSSVISVKDKAETNSSNARNSNDIDEVDGGIISRLFGMCIPRLNISIEDSDEEDVVHSNKDDIYEDDDNDDEDTSIKEDEPLIDGTETRDEFNEDVEDMLQEILQNTNDIVVATGPSIKHAEKTLQPKWSDTRNIQSKRIDSSGNAVEDTDDDNKASYSKRLHTKRNKSIKQQWTMNYINQMSGSESDDAVFDQEHEMLNNSSSNEDVMGEIFSDNDSSYISCDSTPRCVSDCSTFESNDSVLSPQNSRGSTLNQDTPHGSVDITAHERAFKTSQSSSSDSRSTISNNSVISTQSFLPMNSRQFVRSQISVGSMSSARSRGEEIQWQKGSILGKGGFGTVWLGLVNTGEMIAVKQVELSHNDDTEAEKQYEKLQEEVSLLKSLRHENIVRYIGTCLDENFVVNIFMEFVPGGSIALALKRFGAFVETVFRRYTKQILQGVEYLHTNNVIHRDIKGGNIMLMPNGVIKLIDFGCAKRLCMNLSLSRSSMLNSIKGTPYWMAPEVIKETGAGTKADIWSVGCTVFEMATGSPPWSEMQPMTAIFSIGSGSTIPQLGESFSKLARDFTTACMTRDPDARPSATELLQHKFLTE